LGYPYFAWSESLKFQFASLGSGLLPHNDRQIVGSPIPNKISENVRFNISKSPACPCAFWWLGILFFILNFFYIALFDTEKPIIGLFQGAAST
jgi:hypothetical protein